MIFRKVSDVKKERELAERRKDDPALNQTQDHLVRKLFSKFKKSGPVDPPPPPNVIVRDVERGEATNAASTSPSGGENNNKVTSPFMNSTSKAMNGKNKVAAAASSQQSPINVSDNNPNSGTTNPQSTAAPKRLTGWARLKAGSQDQPPTPQPNDLTESLQCNLDLLPSAKNSLDNSKGRGQSGLDKTLFDYDSSIAEMVENSKKTQSEVKKLTERVAKMEDIINDFVQKLNAALPVAVAAASATSGVDDERHYTKRSKSKSRHHHRSSSTSGQVVSGNPTGSPGTAPSNPVTPSNSGNSLKIANNLKLTTKNEEFL
jgi:potassium voltage-gated channel Eag-related subfamily H protein